MKKLFIITILCFIVMSMTAIVSAEEAVKPQKTSYNIAIVPYINSTEETKGYIQEIIDNKYTEQYSNKNFQMIPLVDVQKALNSTGYDISNKELAEKDILASVAKETNADYCYGDITINNYKAYELFPG